MIGTNFKPDDLINICKNNSLNLNDIIGVKFDIIKMNGLYLKTAL